MKKTGIWTIAQSRRRTKIVTYDAPSISRMLKIGSKCDLQPLGPKRNLVNQHMLKSKKKVRRKTGMKTVTCKCFFRRDKQFRRKLVVNDIKRKEVSRRHISGDRARRLSRVAMINK